jgi:protease PrsW
MITAPVLLIAFLGGLLPALLWLVFWQLEDHCDPEPKKLIALSFLAGMLMVPLVLPFQSIVQQITVTYALPQVFMLFLWATIEELFKFGAAWIVILRNRAVDEPIDAIIYMLTVALGFAALENTLFLLGPLAHGDTVGGLLSGNIRFIGATLLHTLASATIGISLALSFYRSSKMRTRYLTGGISLAIILHTLFNYLLLTEGGAGFSVFLYVWIGIIVVLLFFERLKRPARDYC